MNEKLVKKLEKYDQRHLLKFAGELDASQREKLFRQLEEINWDNMDALIREYVLQKNKTPIPDNIQAPKYYPAEPQDENQKNLYSKAFEKGVELLKQGEVALVTVAGGQGTRLGYDGPKGTFPITPIKKKPLFQYFSEKIIRAGKKFGHQFDWYIMTSKVNHDATKDFFESNSYFGLSPSKVHFFVQGMMPAIGFDGKLLLEAPDSLALSPDGHGGTLLALKTSGSLEKMKKDGVKYISYFQVDNPLVSTINPLFIGLHDLIGSEMSCIMLAKTGPFEKLGNFCIANDRLQIIEYSDMPKDLAELKGPDGKLLFIAGSPAIHILSRDFIERLTKDGKLNLPWHRAEKKVPCINSEKIKILPEKPNAVKLESFIFDALPLAEKTLIFEARREDEFSPVKNPEGEDSIVSCRGMLMEKDARWLEASGLGIPRNNDGSLDCMIELSPLSFFDRGDVIERAKHKPFTAPIKKKENYYE